MDWKTLKIASYQQTRNSELIYATKLLEDESRALEKRFNDTARSVGVAIIGVAAGEILLHAMKHASTKLLQLK